MGTSKERRRRRLERQQRLEQADERAFRGVTPSRSYHRYFQDYSESTVLGPNGKKKIVRVYAGKFYSRACSQRAWYGIKVLYLLLFAAAAALMIAAMARPCACNAVWYTVVPGFLTLLFAVLLGTNLVSCAFAPRKMKRYTYGLFERLPAQCLRCAIPAVIYAAAVVCFALREPERAEGAVLSALLAVGTALLFVLLALWERRAKYDASGTLGSDGNGVMIC